MARIIRSYGYKKVRTNGDHAIYKNDKGKIITLTVGHMNICVATRLLKEVQKNAEVQNT